MTLLVFVPQAALAHLVTSGLGPFYDGAFHLVLSPEDLLALIAVSLLAGLSGTQASRLAVTVLSFFWFIAGLAGLYLPGTIYFPWFSIFSFLTLGVLVAIGRKLQPNTVTGFAALIGMFHGLFNGSALAAIGAGPLALSGIVVMVCVVVLFVSALVVSLQASWAHIAVRVAGSWVAAVGMLMCGWLLRGSG